MRKYLNQCGEIYCKDCSFYANECDGDPETLEKPASETERPAIHKHYYRISPVTKCQIRRWKDYYNDNFPLQKFVSMEETMNDDNQEMMILKFLEADKDGDFVFDRVSDVYYITPDNDSSKYVEEIMRRLTEWAR